MAHHNWLPDDPGVTDSDFANAANWDSASVPLDGDSWSIDAGKRNVTGNLNQSAKHFTNCRIGPGFSGRVGVDAATPLHFGANELVIDTIATELFIKAGTGDLDKVIVNQVGAGVLGNLTLIGNIDEASLRHGNILLYSGTMADVDVDAISNLRSQCVVLNRDADITRLWLGEAEFSHDELESTTPVLSALHQRGGRSRIKKGTLTNGYVQGAGAVLEFASSDANPTLVRVLAGILDLSSTSKPITISKVALGARGSLKRSALATITTEVFLGSRETSIAYSASAVNTNPPSV